ncbi:MOSC domain-containing protein [Hoyosella subflava]|uniref:MOSC domain containing protein n=1 Tax=Hoyosella subflava (strain DSM 45089 / JCM 17490 / NBRC 109087 / DQS3-9A1) TaxID=443218 RepID=F6EEQ1_HOYSD|nr:MOSC N-terminal beta barrel domain-containing protein [Hoyosella subflava]AEF40851.1 MOSC domain containing protein [Hoyosella subflava DQS3-9A1]
MDIRGRVLALSRFPVKSTAGESLQCATVTGQGIDHDRRWAVFTAEGRIASGKTTKRFRRVDGLLYWRSTVDGDSVHLHAPDGNVLSVNDSAASKALSDAFGEPLVLKEATDEPHHDDCPVHLVTTSSIESVQRSLGQRIDAARLRANILIETVDAGFPEDQWDGVSLAIGPTVVLRVDGGMPRCRMVDEPQVGVTAEPRMLRAIGMTRGAELGARATVVQSGRITVGDAVCVLG